MPAPLPFNISMVGPVIYTFGTEEQKKRFLPRTANGDDWWCQGFSEPGAGSDLASLKTSAERDGDDYVVNGQKTWTTLAQYADWIFCLVPHRPDGKQQEGISFLLIDMKTPGHHRAADPDRSTAATRSTRSSSTMCEVPVENRVGEENKGWDYAKFLLGNERTGIARVGVSKERIRRIKRTRRARSSRRRARARGPEFREKLAALEIELKALELTQLRVVADEGKHGKGKPNPASSILKIKGTEIQQATTELLLEVVGPFAAPYRRAWRRRQQRGRWTGPRRSRRAISTTARSRSTAAPTRSSATSSPRRCWGCNRHLRRPLSRGEGGATQLLRALGPQ